MSKPAVDILRRVSAIRRFVVSRRKSSTSSSLAVTR